MNYRVTLSLAALFAATPLAHGQEAIPAARPLHVSTAAAVDMLNDLIVPQWVQARPSGELVGSVVTVQNNSLGPVIGSRVAVVRDGVIISETMTTPEGGFVLPNVGPGRYTIVARAPQTISAFSLVVLDAQAGRHLPTQVSLPIAEVREQALYGMLAAAANPAGPTATGGFNESITSDPLGEKRISGSAQDFHVTLRTDGSLVGQLSQGGRAPVASNLGSTNVVIYDGGREVARTQADANGTFTINNLAPGSYGAIVSGQAGFGAIGFRAVAEGQNVSGVANSSGERLVALAQGPADSLNLELGNPSDVAVVEELVLEPIPGATPPAGPPVGGPFGPPAGGGGGVGGGGAGGGGLGAGGLGSFAGLAGLGGLAGLIGDDEDGAPPQPVTPVAGPPFTPPGPPPSTPPVNTPNN